MKNKYNPLVSVIITCYNAEKYLERFLLSLENQSYKNFELIFVNDGSTDKSEIIFNQYKNKLNTKNITYIYQKNSGVSSALNTGLKYFTGEYIIWLDPDDILYENHIEEKVKYMEKNLDITLALSDIDFVNDNDISNIIFSLNINIDDCKFENILNRKGWVWFGLNGIIRVSNFLTIYPDRNIPTTNYRAGGQNCQMFLPLLYKYKYGVIKKSLSKYVIRQNSISRQKFIYIYHTIHICEIWIKSIWKIDTNIFYKFLLCLIVIKNELKNTIKHYVRKFIRV